MKLYKPEEEESTEGLDGVSQKSFKKGTIHCYMDSWLVVVKMHFCQLSMGMNTLVLVVLEAINYPISAGSGNNKCPYMGEK